MTVDTSGHPLSELVHQWEEQRPDLDLTAFRLVGVVMQLAQVLETEFRDLAQSRFGIGSGDLRILMALRRVGEPYTLRPTDLFQSLLVSSGAITKQVDRLAEAGFVKKVLPKGAKRRRVIMLTAKGLRAADYAQEEIATSLAGVAPTFSLLRQKDIETTLRCLEQINDAAFARQNPPADNEEEPDE
ncbi:MarR family winged helix-turn-helix transcriptional regulator [Hydrogenophaga sp.]|uniref:MarR family winged helix-turn-helix transcriptional regulator n=1 Tax=Hydrogenophaga sp. TaxID=1904254 RepID=UPI003F719BAB